MKMYRIYTFI